MGKMSILDIILSLILFVWNGSKNGDPISQNEVTEYDGNIQICENKKLESSKYNYITSNGEDSYIVNNTEAKDVTYSELIEFIEKQNCYKRPYTPGEYVCCEYARDLHNICELNGIRAGYVSLDIVGEEIGHAMNSFKTTDKGLVFIDCTNNQYGDATPSIAELTHNGYTVYSNIDDSEIFTLKKWMFGDIHIFW